MAEHERFRRVIVQFEGRIPEKAYQNPDESMYSYVRKAIEDAMDQRGVQMISLVYNSECVDETGKFWALGQPHPDEVFTGPLLGSTGILEDGGGSGAGEGTGN